MANIVSLTVENFRSYKNKIVFSFEAVDAPQLEGTYHEVALQNGEPIRLLNTAVVYGANAAGKSNVIMALSALVNFVVNSKRNDPVEKIAYEPYMFSSKTAMEPTKMSLLFVVKGVIYEYKIAYTQKAFLSETLKVAGKRSYIFDRNDEGKMTVNNAILPDIQDDVFLRNHLALSELSLKANELIQSIYKEIASIHVAQMSEQSLWNNGTDSAARMLHEAKPDGFLTRMLKSLIVSADTGITGIIVKKPKSMGYFIGASGEKFYFQDKYEVSMLHPGEKGEKVALRIERESRGTQTLFTAGARVIKALEEGSFLAYDEMNIALHPMLFRRLVELFNNKDTNPNSAQLLVTTHDTVLIDDVLLRADQIWFAEKTRGVSSLYSAIDFDGVPIDQPFGPWYRAGRLGARPKLKPYPTIRPNSTKIVK